MAPRILLVDDDPELRKLAKAFLQSEGFEVLSCSDAERALRLFAQHPVDLLMTDINMPGLSGLDLALKLREQRADLPVLVISGAMLAAEQEQAIAQHGFTFVEKPFTIPQLVGLIGERVGLPAVEEPEMWLASREPMAS